jgi:ubiquitin-protein ligase
MDAKQKRREEDLRKLRALVLAYPGVVEIIPPANPSLSVITVRLKLPTARDTSYPRNVQEQTDIRIEMSQEYPFREPRVTVLTPVWNPNVYSNAVVCLGTKWLATQGLDLLVVRLMQLLAFDPLIVNTASPANRAAADWHLAKRRAMSGLFPTIDLRKLQKAEPGKGMKWKPVEEPGTTKVIVACPSCRIGLRVDRGRTLKGKCPRCSSLIELKS